MCSSKLCETSDRHNANLCIFCNATLKTRGAAGNYKKRICRKTPPQRKEKITRKREKGNKQDAHVFPACVVVPSFFISSRVGKAET